MCSQTSQSKHTCAKPSRRDSDSAYLHGSPFKDQPAWGTPIMSMDSTENRSGAIMSCTSANVIFRIHTIRTPESDATVAVTMHFSISESFRLGLRPFESSRVPGCCESGTSLGEGANICIKCHDNPWSKQIVDVRVVLFGFPIKPTLNGYPQQKRISIDSIDTSICSLPRFPGAVANPIQGPGRNRQRVGSAGCPGRLAPEAVCKARRKIGSPGAPSFARQPPGRTED